MANYLKDPFSRLSLRCKVQDGVLLVEDSASYSGFRPVCVIDKTDNGYFAKIPLQFAESPDYVTLTAAAEMLDMSRQGCWKLCKSGKLDFFTIENKMFVAKHSISEYIESRDAK